MLIDNFVMFNAQKIKRKHSKSFYVATKNMKKTT